MTPTVPVPPPLFPGVFVAVAVCNVALGTIPPDPEAIGR